VDRHDNLWVVANQEDEIDVIDPNAITTQGALAKVIAKRGDFEGLSQSGTVQGLLFPASTAFSLDRNTLYVSNLSLFLPNAGCLRRRSTRPGRSRSSTTRSPRFASRSQPSRITTPDIADGG
jgi:hypothetical protein